MLRGIAVPAAIGAVLALMSTPASAQAPRLTPVDTLDTPVSMTAPPGDGRRLHVVERAGAIRVVRDGAVLTEPFLDLTAEVDTTREGGLLSMAFPPDYVATGYFYVFITPRDADPGVAPHAPIQVREYRRSASDPDRADPASGRTVLSIRHDENANHYGGQLQFGPDGLLYVSTGDGGGSGDPAGNAQNTGVRLGKLLRISPRPAGGEQFAVPASNPFVGRPEDDLLWSYGLRNPYRFSFDRLTGDLTIGDVGENRAEEIDFVPAANGGGAGANFAWRECEGPFAYPRMMGTNQPCSLAGRTDPVHHYLADAQARCGSSITGGVVVRDPGLEALTGRYVYGDFCKGFMRSLQLAVPSASDDRDLGVGVNPSTLAAFGEDACGRVYVVQLSGAVSRLEDGTPSACTATVEYGRPADAAPEGGQNSGGSARAPKLRLILSRSQPAVRRGAVVVRAGCDQLCSLRARGRLASPSERAPRLKQARRASLRSGVTIRLRLALPRATRAALRRALRRGAKPRVRLNVRARAPSGPFTVLHRTVRIIG